MSKTNSVNVDQDGIVVSRLPITILSVIEDREQGASLVESVFDSKVNKRVLTHLMHKDGVLQKVAVALQNGTIGQIFEELIDHKTFRVGGLQDTKVGVYKSALKVVGEPAVALCLSEIFMPWLIELGFVNGNTRFAVRRKVGYKTVDIDDLREELFRTQINEALDAAVRIIKLEPKAVNSTAAVAQEINEAFRTVGISMSTLSNYDRVLNDLQLGVLANIDIAPFHTQRGSVPAFYSNHSVTTQLVTNFTFVKAALQLRAGTYGVNGPDEGMAVQSSEYLFDKYAPIVLTMLRNSERYQIVSKQAYLSKIGCHKVYNLKGQPVSTILYDNVGMEAAAMAVIALDDVTMEGAKFINEMDDRVSERLISAYGTLDKTMTLGSVAAHTAELVGIGHEAGAKIDSAYTCRLSSVEKMIDKQTIAMLVADKVVVEYQPSREDGEVFTMIYSGETDHKTVELEHGTIIAGRVTTTSADELLLVVDEWEASTMLPVPPQLIPRQTKATRLINFDKDDFVPAGERGGYKLDIMGVNLSGTIRLRELSTLRSAELYSLVVPHHNVQVFAAIEDSLNQLYNFIESVEEDNIKIRLKRKYAALLLQIAQSLSPQFRGGIQNEIAERAAKTLSYEDSLKMRATMRQQSLGAHCDVVAASIFFKIQGLVETQSIFDSAMEDLVITNYWSEAGTDR